MKKKVLNIDTEIKIGIIGICSVAKDYRLCWEINKLLKINLTQNNKKLVKNLSLEKKYAISKSTKVSSLYSGSTFSFKKEEKGVIYKLISNTNQHGERLVPEQKQVDFFMLITGVDYKKEQFLLAKELRTLHIILTAFEIPANSIKTNLNLFINDS